MKNSFKILFCLLPILFHTGIYAGDDVARDAPLLRFTENLGQWPDQVFLECQMPGGRIFFEKNSWTFEVTGFETHEHDDHVHRWPTSQHIFSLQYLGANPSPEVEKRNPAEDYKNYFLGKDQSMWAGGVRHYENASIKSLYDGVNLRLNSIGSTLKYDYILEAAVNPSIIQWTYSDDVEVCLDNGALIVKNTVNHTSEMIPAVYQPSGDQRIPIKCEFTLNNGVVGFHFPDGYDPTKGIVIDPTLVFSSYVGSTADDWGTTATYDSESNAFGAGTCFGQGYPTTVGVVENDFQGGQVDMSIAKFKENGTTLLWASYLGGSDTDIPHSTIANSNDELIVFGTTGSSNFPTTANAYDDSFNGGNNFTNLNTSLSFTNGSDIVLSRFSADGTQLIGSTFLGGDENDGLNESGSLVFNYGDAVRGEVIVDANDDIYITTTTRSSDFPMVGGGFQTTFEGDQDAVVAKLNDDLSGLVWSTFLGGNSSDAGYSLKLDGAQSLFVSGGTISSDFPVAGGVTPTYQGGSADGFIMKLSNDGTSLLASTFVGTNSYDQTYFIEIDRFENAYVLGQTKGDYPVSAGVYSDDDGSQFIHKFSNDLNTSLLSTVFGSGSAAVNISPTAFLVDICERIYVAGWGGILNPEGNTNNMALTGDAFDPFTDGNDFYLMVLEADASDLLYGSYIGGGDLNDHVDGGTSRFDKRGSVYQAVCAGCGGGFFGNEFPTTNGAWQETNISTNCNLAVFKFDFELGNIFAQASIDSLDVIDFGEGCINAFAGSYSQAFYQSDPIDPDVDYYWDFGDGEESTLPEPIHDYEAPGVYEIMMVVVDSSTCNISDTAFVMLEVFAAEAFDADFDFTVGNTCAGDFEVDFAADPGAIGDEYSVAWDFLDIGVYLDLGDTPSFNFSGPGVYPVSMVIRDSLPCLLIDTINLNVELTSESFVEASFELEDPDCIPYNINTSVENPTTDAEYSWQINGVEEAQTEDFQYEISDAGTYVVALFVEIEGDCPAIDSSFQTIEVFTSDPLSADFDFSIGNTCEGDFTVDFEADVSVVGTEYLIAWDFNDDFVLNDFGANTSFDFIGPGSYSVNMIVIDSLPCLIADTVSVDFELTTGAPVLADFDLPPSDCAPISVNTVVENITAGIEYTWLVDGIVQSDATSYQAIFDVPGTYEIGLIAEVAGDCPGIDSLFQSIEVYPVPVAEFEFSPENVEATLPVQFTQLGENAFPVSYNWDFGDGNVSQEENPQYIYSNTGSYNVCLEVSTETGQCIHVDCEALTVFSDAFIDVPTAFTPNGDGQNDVFEAVSKGVLEMELRIYNRWGKLLFVSRDPEFAWDGSYEGKMQDVAVYVYQLEALLAGGREVSKKGNISLLR